jgi:hypothetical protein
MSPAHLADGRTELLSTAERDLIRREFCVRFGTPPRLADGILLRIWRSGPLTGQPKVPAAVQSLVERGLMVVQAKSAHLARAYFTEAGLDTIRWLALQRRGLDPVSFAHVRRELGIEAPEAAGPK